MSSRFFVDSPITQSEAVLHGAEAHHLLNVMRAKVGDTFTLFDGTGREFEANITTLRRSAVEFHITAVREVDRELKYRIDLAAPLPKGDRQRFLIEKAVELGVSQFIPLVTQRSVSQPQPAARKRLARTVIEASKQCGRNRLMLISEPTTAVDWFQSLGKQHTSKVALPVGIVAHLDSEAPDTDAKGIASFETSHLQLAVGPEGGFTEQEIESARRHGWRFANLGPRILRVETAAMLLAAQAVFALKI